MTQILRPLLETKKNEKNRKPFEIFEGLDSKDALINIDDVALTWAIEDHGNMMPHHQIVPFFVKS